MSSDLACEDSELIQSAKEGDLSAFDALVSRHQERVYMISHHMLRNHDDALDVAQDTFLRAWKGLSRFDGKVAFSTWIVKIATNASIDVIRRRQVRPQADLDTVELRAEAGSRTTPSDPEKPGVRLDLEEMRRRYDAAMLQLTAEHRAVLVLKELEDMSYQEIADAVGCSTGTVMSRLFYARKKMQSKLRDIYEEL